MQTGHRNESQSRHLERQPPARANGGTMGRAWVYMEKVEPRHRWEHSDEKNMNKLVE